MAYKRYNSKKLHHAVERRIYTHAVFWLITNIFQSTAYKYTYNKYLTQMKKKEKK